MHSIRSTYRCRETRRSAAECGVVLYQPNVGKLQVALCPGSCHHKLAGKLGGLQRSPVDLMPVGATSNQTLKASARRRHCTQPQPAVIHHPCCDSSPAPKISPYLPASVCRTASRQCGRLLRSELSPCAANCCERPQLLTSARADSSPPFPRRCSNLQCRTHDRL